MTYDVVSFGIWMYTHLVHSSDQLILKYNFSTLVLYQIISVEESIKSVFTCIPSISSYRTQLAQGLMVVLESYCQSVSLYGHPPAISRGNFVR